MNSLFGTVLLPLISRYLSSDNIEDKIERVNFTGQPSRVSVRTFVWRCPFFYQYTNIQSTYVGPPFFGYNIFEHCVPER